MTNFLRLENLLLPTNQIKTVTTPTVNGESIVEVAILALSDTFKFDGQAAARVYAQLETFKPAPTPNVVRTIALALTVNGVVTVPSALYLVGEDTPAIVNIDGQAIPTDSIEWADLSTDFGTGNPGVELRVSTDAPGITRQYLLEKAAEAFDVLSALVPEQTAAAA